MTLTADDIYFTHAGFIVEKIRKASDKKLTALEDALNDAGFIVEWTALDDLGCLSAVFRSKVSFTTDEKNTITQIIQKLFR